MHKFLFLLILLPLLSFSYDPGDRTGNGGDYVRTSFILEGHRVLKMLEVSRDGLEFCSVHKLSLPLLSQTLKTSVIEVTTDRLFDHFGNEVDALGEKSKITLNKARWEKMFESDMDLRALIFHEILRAADINDDDYVISNDLPLQSLPDLYLSLRKSFKKIHSSSIRELQAFLNYPTNQNKVWSCEFANQQSSFVFRSSNKMQMDLRGSLSILDQLTRLKIVSNMSFYDQEVELVQIPGFPMMEEIKFDIKFHSREIILLNFDDFIYGECRPL